MVLETQETAAEENTPSRKNYALAKCVFCGDEEIASPHYSKRHGLKVSEHARAAKGRAWCMHCNHKGAGNVHDAVRHLAEAHPDILEGLGITIPVLEKEEARRKPTYIEALHALGFDSATSRRKWLDEHEEEIARYIELHGMHNAQTHFHISPQTARRIRDKVASAAQAPESEAPSDFQYVLPDGGVLELLEVGAGVIGELFAVLRNEYRSLEQENQDLREALVTSQEEKQRIVEGVNERLLKDRGATKISLGDLQRLHGRGQDGTRRSFVPSSAEESRSGA